MSYQYLKLLAKRAEETDFIYKRFNGDRRQYTTHKTIQEFRKRRRQNRVSVPEMQRQMNMHFEMFPAWFDVKDCTDEFCSKDLLSWNLASEPQQSFVIPVECSNDKDMCDVLKQLLTEKMDIRNMFVTCTYGNDTKDVPHKSVLMKHINGNAPIVEALKYQERYLSPVTLHNVVGGKFDDQDRVVLVTKDWMYHTRYLYKDWENIQCHDNLPKFDNLYRICYIIEPSTLSFITVSSKNAKYIIKKATNQDQWKLSKDSIASCIEILNRFSQQ